jgi:hypothetical protein
MASDSGADDAAALRERVDQLEQTVAEQQATIESLSSPPASRRGVLAALTGVAGAGALGAYSQRGSAQAAGQVGTSAEPVDVVSNDITTAKITDGDDGATYDVGDDLAGSDYTQIDRVDDSDDTSPLNPSFNSLPAYDEYRLTIASDGVDTSLPQYNLQLNSITTSDYRYSLLTETGISSTLDADRIKLTQQTGNPFTLSVVIRGRHIHTTSATNNSIFVGQSKFAISNQKDVFLNGYLRGESPPVTDVSVDSNGYNDTGVVLLEGKDY